MKAPSIETMMGMDQEALAKLALPLAAELDVQATKIAALKDDVIAALFERNDAVSLIQRLVPILTGTEPIHQRVSTALDSIERFARDNKLTTKLEQR